MKRAKGEHKQVKKIKHDDANENQNMKISKKFGGSRKRNAVLLAFVGLFAALGAYMLFHSLAATSVTISVDFNNTNVPAFRQYNQYQSYIQRVKGPADLAAVDAVGTKYERVFERPCVYAQNGYQQYTWTNQDRFNLQDQTIDEMKAHGILPIVTNECVPAWLASGTNADHPNNVPPNDWAKYTTTLKDAYVHIKQRYPATEYIESYNEANLSSNHMSEADQYKFYDATSDAVKAANAQLGLPLAGNPTSNPALKLGGPVFFQTDAAAMGRFLDHINGRPGTKLDYISWHMYNYAGIPAQIKTAVDSIRSVATTKGYPGIELMITEWASTTNTSPPIPNSYQLSQESAFDAAALYQYMQAGLDKPFVFAQSNYNGVVDSLLVPMPISPAPVIDATDGKVFPAYNLYKMYSMMRPTRVSATSTPALDANGLGVGAIATKDASSATILAWNWLGLTNSQITALNIQLNNLPAAFAGKSITVERYVIDMTHSNYANSSSNDGLARLSDLTLPAGTTSITGESLGLNGIELLVLKPGATSTTTGSPTVSSISIANGSTAGGTAVTITGTNFVSGATVTFGGVAGTSVNVTSATSLTVIPPAHAAGSVDVKVTNTDGKSTTLTSGYTYTATTTAPSSNAAYDKLGFYPGYADVTKFKSLESWLGHQAKYAVQFGDQSIGAFSGSVWGEVINPAATPPTAFSTLSSRLTFVASLPLAFGANGDASTTASQSYNKTALTDTVNGVNDSAYKLAAGYLKTGGYCNAIIRLGWEFDGTWYPWSSRGNETLFVSAYKHVHDLLKGVCPNFQFDWNGDNSWLQAAVAAYPGDSYVDYIGLDSYDSGQAWSTFQTNLAYGRDFAISHGKQVSYPEWGTPTDNPTYIQNMYDWFNSLPASGAGSLGYQSYFNSPGSGQDFTIFPATSKPNASAKFQSLFGGATAPAVTPPAALQPDLVVSNVSISPTSPTGGDQVAFTSVIKNQGSGATPAGTIVGVSFSVDGTKVTWSDTTTSSLAAGASVTVTANSGPTGSATWTATTGAHTVEAYVDDINRIANESNETNNKLSTNFTVAAPDKTPPTTAITSPASNSILKGSANVTADGADSGGSGLARVDLFVDGASTPVASDFASPFIYSLNTASFSNGTHNLTTVAYDNAGNSTTSTAVAVTIDNTVPVTSISSPSANASLAGTKTVSASASDTITGVAKVEFYVDGNLTGSPDTTGPYSFTWNTSAIADGTHSITVKATDGAGNVTTSAAVSVKVDNSKPVTAITVPAAGTTLSGTTTLTATATDNTAVTKVEFYRGGTTLIGTSTTASSPYSFSWDTSSTAKGTYGITSIAYDAAGNTTTSASVSVIVNNTVAPPADTTKPTVSIDSPSDNSTVMGSTTIGFTANDNVGITKVELYIGTSTTPAATDSIPPFNSFTWDSATVADGSSTIKVVAYDGATPTSNSNSATVNITVNNAPPPINGDMNSDRHVKLLDLQLFLNNYLKTNATRADGDFSGDHIVNLLDLQLLLNNFGT